MSRRMCFGIGGTLMAALLGIAVFGPFWPLADPYAARGSLLGAFIIMHYRRWACRALVTRDVVGASLLGSLVLSLGLLWSGLQTDWIPLIAGAAFAATVCTAMMACSFYFLTLRRGWMP